MTVDADRGVQYEPDDWLTVIQGLGFRYQPNDWVRPGEWDIEDEVPLVADEFDPTKEPESIGVATVQRLNSGSFLVTAKVREPSQLVSRPWFGVSIKLEFDYETNVSIGGKLVQVVVFQPGEGEADFAPYRILDYGDHDDVELLMIDYQAIKDGDKTVWRHVRENEFL